MLSTVKQVLESTAAAQNLNFAFVSFKEIDPNLDNFDLTKSTILVNSTIRINQEKTQTNLYDQEYDLTIACVKKRQVESSDNTVFDVIIAVEIDFLPYLNAIAESYSLNYDLGKIQLKTIYFGSANPVAGLEATIKMKTFCNQ